MSPFPPSGNRGYVRNLDVQFSESVYEKKSKEIDESERTMKTHRKLIEFHIILPEHPMHT